MLLEEYCDAYWGYIIENKKMRQRQEEQLKSILTMDPSSFI